MRGKTFKKNSPEKSRFMAALWKSKSDRRKFLANLPIKEKIKILISLQQAAYPILVKRNKYQLSPWTINKARKPSIH
jgi:hypothetical protein